MKCPRCQHKNRSGAKFCEECAAPLARRCPNCGAEVGPAAKFCSECAHPTGVAVTTPGTRFGAPETYTPRHLAERILTSKPALEGERKLVTVLFADLKGSMELLADRDPEDARKILDPVLERMMEAVHRYEGTVNQVMGDGIMALFGAPVAHEDHAVRACYAALRMQESVKRYADGVRRDEGIAVRIRVGLNSGEVVVRAIGSDLHMDYTAVGQTTHLAARMEQLADPAAVLLTPTTLALAEDFIQVRSLGPTPVKGLATPVEVYELVGATAVRSRFQAHAARGLTKFVGRASEMAQIRDALELARSGRGQVVAVVGEPGVGKSRLFWEFAHSHRTGGCLVVESASVSYGKATAYLPVIDLLRGYFQIEPRDDIRKMREKVTGKLLSLDRALELIVPPLFSLLDVPVEDNEWTRLDPPQRRQRTLDAVKGLLLRESQVQPLVVVFEDLHWIDGQTQAVLDALTEGLPTARMLLLVNYRPEYRHGWGGKTYYRQLQIDALPAASAEELLHGLLGSDPALDPLARMLIARTEGNPLFLEESVRTLVETGILLGEAGAHRLARDLGSLQIPATAQAIVSARIDRLEPEDKRLLQAASVIGKDVPLALLEAIAELPEDELRQRLARLQASEFLYEARLFPEVEYTFKHALTHEVTYGGLLQERRRELHARIVAAIEALHRERVDEHIERLAHHALHGEMREKAVNYLRRAGVKAAARSAPRDARGWFEQALEVLDALAERSSTLEAAFDIRLELRSVLMLLSDPRRALERLREAENLARQLNDHRRRGRVCALLTNAHAQLGDLDESVVAGTSALEIARRLGDLRLRLLATSLLEHTYEFRGEYDRVVELATGNLAALPTEWLYEDVGAPAPTSVYDRWKLVVSLAQLGRFTEAARYEAEAIQLAEPTHHAFTIAVTLWAASTRHLLAGEWTKARTAVERWIAVARTGNVVLHLPTAVSASAWALAQLGETSEALSRYREGDTLHEAAVARGLVGQGGWVHCMLGRTALLLGHIDEALRLADRAIEFSQAEHGFAAHAQHLLGDIATHPERFNAERAESHYRQALALAEPRGMRPLIAHCHFGLGTLYGRTDQRRQSQEHIASATTMYGEMEMTYWLEKAEAALKAFGR